jgi:large subunit ribosomal protein LX|tara:strand:+ start:233 stop:460 length:228 start_codon:yes stop_codon:yes gene_type:complete
MKVYRVVGSFPQGKANQEFSMDLVATDEDEVKEKIMSNFGSRHGAKRRKIIIETIETIDPSQSIAPAVISYFRGK